MKIALIGAGEMGAAVGGRLHERGARVVTSLRGRSPASAERAHAAGLEIVHDDRELVDGAEFVLSIVPPGQALDVARALAAPLARARQRPRYVDCNAIAPGTVAKIAAAIEPTGCDFIDAGIVGGPPAAGYEGPRIYASGPAAAALEALTAFGLFVRVLDGDAGLASALKMSYAGITKGLTGIGAAMMLDASRAGVAAALRRELEESQPHVFAWLSRQVPRMYGKAYRWVAEMEEIAAFSHDDPATEAIYQGLARLYEDFAGAYERRNGASDSRLDSVTDFVK
jgi:L-threonate 2-dehydrogenase